MALRKNTPKADSVSLPVKPLSLSKKLPGNVQMADLDIAQNVVPNIDLDMREVYFLMLHLLSSGPCQKTYALLRHELLEHELLPRRYHAWYSRSGLPSGDENDDGDSFPLNYAELVKRYSHVKKDHLVELLKQLVFVSSRPTPSRGLGDGNGNKLIAAGVPTLLGCGSFSLLSYDKDIVGSDLKPPPISMRWPHMRADQVRGLSLREIGGGFARHHRAPSIRAACYVIAKPSTMVQKMQNIKRIRGHRNAVYCAIFDRSGRYVITGSDDRLVKVWSMETAYCLTSCRGHEGDITDLAVSSNNTFIASASNDCVIRVWRLPDGLPVSVLRGHTGAVTAIAFSPRPGSPYQLLSSSDDGTCRIWDARGTQVAPRIYVPRPPSPDGKNNVPSSSSNAQQSHQIFSCAFNANGSVFVTGSSDTLARVYSVWSANKINNDDPDQPNHEMDVLAGHENDVNYVQFSGCAAGYKFAVTDYSKDDSVPKFKNSWFCHENIVTCSRDGSAIIWIPRSRRSHGKSCRWTRAYHLKVPPPPMPPQPPRGGPRQRILPTPRGVNMIAWSLDNRFVLAAIMDCRICVWNASDGSLVHSLTGHTASTYVMDVHPFNPRLAMSAGYDGQTIVWDIWEGIPIETYKISHFKLVDGKFSPDGTSIILSDDVGQLYVLSTGQGDSQKDAKYDQFFLGDYRPLIQDLYGNVLDQESQLPPYRRNMEDPLCDSAMIPYEEPYQTMFQKRRLGALGKEWRPSALKLAVGPDITLDQDYQMPPLADLDLLAEPLPEFVDVMEWEPEVDIMSDENDSEYNVPEEYSSGKEKECLNSSTSGESGSSSSESDEDGDHQNSLRRSKRKRHKTGAGIMTSSGRRVKKKNSDELEGATNKNKRTRKSRSGRKESKRKSSKSKSSRPRRAAAQNALSWFSKITGRSKDAEEEEDISELSGSSESESTTQDSGSGDSELDVALLNGNGKQSKGKNILVCDSDDGAQQCDTRETHPAEQRKRLVVRFPVKNSDKLTLLDNLPGTSSLVPTPTLGNGCAEDSSVPENLEHTNQFNGLDVSEVRWGMVKARTPKRMRGEAKSSHGLMGSEPGGKENNVNEDANHHDNGVTAPSCLELRTDTDGVAVDSGLAISNGLPNGDERCLIVDGSPTRMADDGGSKCSEDVTGGLHDLKDSLPPLSKTLRIRSKRVSRAPDTSLKQEVKSSSLNEENDGSVALNDGSADTRCDLALESQKDGVVGTELSLRNYCAHESNPPTSDPVSIANDVHVKHPKRMFEFVYSRLKSRKLKNNSDGEASLSQEISPGSGSQDQGTGANSLEGAPNGFHETESNGLEKSEGNLTDIQDKPSISRGNKNSQEEERSTSGATLRLRSTRNRRSTYPFSESKPAETKKPQQSIEKVSWLTLSTHEEGSRYIPQKGDEVAYLRQGHEEYLKFSSLREVAPWTSVKGGNMKAVEICKVESLEYATLAGSGDSCCKMILKVINPDSEVFNKTFKLTLPDVVTFPDFLVERSRYEAAIQRNWTFRDKCKVWWRDEGEEDGSWWEGRILAVKAKAPEFPDSPWERYTVKYKSDPTETHLHSPWELFDADTKWEQPHIDEEERNRLLLALTKLETSNKRTKDSYGLQKLNQTVGSSSYTNMFPVPLSLEVIRSRLENNYYRSVEALRHDVAVMLSNAETFFGRNKSVAAKISRLSKWFDRTLPS